ncbi:hypothetical protein NT6N_27460 [Oceaniferula spumae]|uniref:Uncharacterized protein n=1 Tax=Oceaniferula spumae TaxID=2979115 RepID=A0AAT9FNV8_9BACT
MDSATTLTATTYLSNHYIPMRTICLLSSAVMLSLLPSCALVGSLLKIPGSILKTAGRTVGVSNLTDEAPQPELDEAPQTEEKNEVTPTGLR